MELNKTTFFKKILVTKNCFICENTFVPEAVPRYIKAILILENIENTPLQFD